MGDARTVYDILYVSTSSISSALDPSVDASDDRPRRKNSDF